MLILTERISKEKLNEPELLGEKESFFEDMESIFCWMIMR